MTNVAKYARVVVRIADRELISLPRAARLYQKAVALGISDYSRGLAARIGARRKNAYLVGIEEATIALVAAYARDLEPLADEALKAEGLDPRKEPRKLREKVTDFVEQAIYQNKIIDDAHITKGVALALRRKS